MEMHQTRGVVLYTDVSNVKKLNLCNCFSRIYFVSLETHHDSENLNENHKGHLISQTYNHEVFFLLSLVENLKICNCSIFQNK